MANSYQPCSLLVAVDRVAPIVTLEPQVTFWHPDMGGHIPATIGIRYIAATFLKGVNINIKRARK